MPNGDIFGQRGVVPPSLAVGIESAMGGFERGMAMKARIEQQRRARQTLSEIFGGAVPEELEEYGALRVGEAAKLKALRDPYKELAYMLGVRKQEELEEERRKEALRKKKEFEEKKRAVGVVEKIKKEEVVRKTAADVSRELDRLADNIRMGKTWKDKELARTEYNRVARKEGRAEWQEGLIKRHGIRPVYEFFFGRVKEPAREPGRRVPGRREILEGERRKFRERQKVMRAPLKTGNIIITDGTTYRQIPRTQAIPSGWTKAGR